MEEKAIISRDFNSEGSSTLTRGPDHDFAFGSSNSGSGSQTARRFENRGDEAIILYASTAGEVSSGAGERDQGGPIQFLESVTTGPEFIILWGPFHTVGTLGEHSY